MAKPKRTRGGTGPPPPVFPDPPRGFTLAPLHKVGKSLGNAVELTLLNRNIPQDWDHHAQRISGYVQAIRRAYHGPSAPPPEIGGHAWYPLHWAWQEHPQFGVEPFFWEATRKIEARFPGFDPDRLPIAIGVNALPDGRLFPAPFEEPHILLALFPDGEFTRLLATQVLGPVAVTARHPDDAEEMLGPVCLAVRGQVLNDGRLQGEANPDSIVLMDPLVLVGDFGPSDQVVEGRHLYSSSANPTRIYHPQDEPQFSHLRDEQQRYVTMWHGPVPGFVGKLGQFKKFLEDGQREEQARHQAVPTHAVYARALEQQMAVLGFMRRERPYERVARSVARERNDRRATAGFFDFARAQDDVVIASLERAHPVFWTADMLTVLEGLEPSLKVWTVQERDFLHPDGFVWFERSLRIMDGDTEVMTGYLWTRLERDGVRGIQVTPFTRYEGRPQDVPLDTWADSISGNAPAHGAPRRALFFPLGDTLERYLVRVDAWHGVNDDALHPDAAEQAAQSATYSGTTPEIDRAQMTRWARIFAASIVLMNQRLTRLSDFRTDRAGRKRAQSALAIDHEPPLIKTVLLRRVDYVGGKREPGEAGTVNWSHRWLVSFHWREQWYPSENRHKSIAIQPYEKGPKDKPLWVPRDGSVDLIGR